MSDRVNAKLYKIRDSIIDDKNDGSNVLIEEIVQSYFQRTNNKFIEKRLDINIDNTEITTKYNSRLFTFNTPIKSPHWLDFLVSIVSSNTDLENLEIKSSSFVLFIYNENNVFAVTKGYHGHHLLSEYIDDFFGLEVLSRLVDTNSTEIKQIEERSIFGNEIGAQRFFKDFNLSYDDDFGKIYKTMLASIDEENFSKLSIFKKKKNINKVSAMGSSSFELSTNFDYEELVNRIDNIVDLLKTEGIQFNQFYRLKKTDLSLIKDDLDRKIVEYAYDAYKNNETVDFYHPDVFNYLRSTMVEFVVDGDPSRIPFASSKSFTDIMNQLIQENKLDAKTDASFTKSLMECHGGFISAEDEQFVNHTSIVNWLGGEVELNGKKYFKIDNSWYKYRDNFDKYLNRYISGLSQEIFPSVRILKQWNHKTHATEHKYNLEHKKSDEFIIGDKVFLNNIEIADLIKITPEKIFLYHVKKGLGRDLRVLSNQIINAARIIETSLGEDEYHSLKKYYKNICDYHYDGKEIEYKSKNTTKKISETEFIELFTTKKIAFVFAYSSKNSIDIKKELKRTNSRIAKLSLIYCIRDMGRVNSDFYIERINEV